MSVTLGLCVVGGGSGCRACELLRGFGLFRSAKKALGRNRKSVARSGGAASGLLGDRASSNSANEWKLSRFRDAVVVRYEDLNHSPPGGRRMSKFAEHVFRASSPRKSPQDHVVPLGGRRMSKLAECSFRANSPQKSVWPLFNERAKDPPRINSSSHQNGRIYSSSHQNGRTDDTEPPPLFMGNQMKRFSHSRDGVVHWCRYLEIKKDGRNHGQGILVRDDEHQKTQIGKHQSYVISNGEDSTYLAASGEDGTYVTEIGEDPNYVTVGSGSEASEMTVICFDIETTGFSRNEDRIIEFAARDLAGGVCSTIQTLVNPGREVRNEHIHKISSRMVNNSSVPKWRDVALALVDFVASRRKGQGLVVLVAHNAKSFDVPFVMHEFRACGVSMPSYWRFFDSIRPAREAMKMSGISPTPKTSLGELSAFYNIPWEGTAHRGLADVNMLAQVLQRLMNDLEMSTSELLDHSFGADDVVLKGQSSLAPKKEVINSSEGVVTEKIEPGNRTIVDDVNEAGSGSVPWDFLSKDSEGGSRRNGVEVNSRTLRSVKFGQVWRPSSQQYSNPGNGTAFHLPDLYGVEGPSKKIIRQQIGQAGPTPLMRNPPRVVRTPALPPTKVDVKRDIQGA